MLMVVLAIHPRPYKQVVWPPYLSALVNAANRFLPPIENRADLFDGHLQLEQLKRIKRAPFTRKAGAKMCQPQSGFAP
jgi:hypothetical protein